MIVEAKESRSEVELPSGSIFAEIGLFSGRRRSATVRAGRDAMLLEIPRATAMKFIATIPAFKEGIDRLILERMVRSFVGAGLTSRQIRPVLEAVQLKSFDAGQVMVNEGDDNRDILLIRSGSVAVTREKTPLSRSRARAASTAPASKEAPGSRPATRESCAGRLQRSPEKPMSAIWTRGPGATS